VYEVYEINSKVFFLSRHFIFGRSYYIGIKNFSFGRHVFLRGRLTLVILYSGKYGIKLHKCNIFDYSTSNNSPIEEQLLDNSKYCQ